MLENYSSLNECEKVLSSSLTNVECLGEVDFSIRDIEVVSGLIKEKFSGDEGNGLRALRAFPACLSFYLVGRGFFSYQGGEFWPPIVEELGISVDRNQSELGAIFLIFLRSKGLPRFRIKGALSYIAPILLHGGIPFSCFNNFFEIVVKYLLEHRMIEESDIRKEITRVRESDRHRRELLEQKEDIFNRMSSIKRVVDQLENIIVMYNRLDELAEKASEQEMWADLLGYQRLIATRELQQKSIDQVTQELLNKKAAYMGVIESYTLDDQKLLDLSKEIDKLDQELKLYQDALEKLPSLEAEEKARDDELKSLALLFWQWVKEEQSDKEPISPKEGSEIEIVETQKILIMTQRYLFYELSKCSTRCESHITQNVDEFISMAKEQPSLMPLVIAGEMWASRFKGLQSVCRELQHCELELAQLKHGMAEWETALDQVAAASPIPITKPSEQAIAALAEGVARAGERKKEADEAKDKLEKEVFPALHEVVSRKVQVEQEIVLVDQRYRELGKGDPEAGARIYQKKKLALVELKKVEEKLDRCLTSPMSSSLDKALGLEQKLIQQNRELKSYIDLKRERLTQIIPEPGGWGDLPDYRSFRAAKEQELNDIEREIKKLKNREKEYLGLVHSLTSSDQKNLKMAVGIGKLSQDLIAYQEQQNKQELLKVEVEKRRKETKSLSSELWPGGWNVKYNNNVLRLDSQSISREMGRFVEANELRIKTQKTLGKSEINTLRPSPVVWLGGVLVPTGVGLVLTAQNSTGYVFLLAGLVLLSAGLRRFRRDKEHQAQQVQYQKMLEQILLRAKADLEGGRGRLAELLKGLPVSPEALIAAGGKWVDRFMVLQAACQEHQRCEQELTFLKQGMAAWETTLAQVAATMTTPVTGPPEQVITKLAIRVILAGLRKKISDTAIKTMQEEVYPALICAWTRRVQVEREIAAVEQRLRDLGNGDTAEGLRLLEEIQQALAEKEEVELKLDRHRMSQMSGKLDDAVELEQKLIREIEDLRRYIALKREQEKLMEMTAGFEAWAGLPDYYPFIADREVELHELERELKKLKETESACQERISLYTANDRKLLEVSEVIKKLAQDRILYKERQKRHGRLEVEAKERKEEIETLVSNLWPGSWGVDYSVSILVGSSEFIEELASFDLANMNDWRDTLKRLEAVHREYRQCVEVCTELKREIDEWEKSLNRITSTLSIPMEESPGQVIELKARLKQAESRKEAAGAAKEALETDVFTSLQDAECRRAQIKQEIAVVVKKLEELGKGNFEAGKRVLEEKNQALLELKEVERKLEQNILAIPQGLGNCQEVHALKEEKSKELEIIKADHDRVDRQLDNYIHPFVYADEPVQRFVIYGGEWVINWLCACIALHRYYLKERIDIEYYTTGIPARVVNGLDQLVQNVIKVKKVKQFGLGPERGENEEEREQEKKDDQAGIIREHYSKPEIILDTNRGELKMAIGGHRFPIFDRTSSLEIYVHITSGETPPTWKEEIHLRGYYNNGMVEVPQEDIKLPLISSEYLVTLYVGGIAHPMRVNACGREPYMIFSEKGKKVEPSHFAEQRAWLLFPGDYELFPDKAVVSESELYLNGSSYRLVLVNFLLEPIINLADEKGHIFEIASAVSELPVHPFLSNEEIAMGAWAEGKRPIYNGKVPRLCVPFNDKDEIKEWTVRIGKSSYKGSNEKNIDGQEISNFGWFSERKIYEVSLSSKVFLGPHPLGEYTIILSHRDIGEYSFDLVIFPGLMLFFEKNLYFPHDAIGNEIKLTLAIADSQVQVLQPARLMSESGDKFNIAVEQEREEIVAELNYTSVDGQGRTFITIEIPKVRWRIKGANKSSFEKWSHQVKEIWHETLYESGNTQLEVDLPGYLNNSAARVKVYLRDTGRQVVSKARGRLPQFELTGLADTLRGGKELYSLWLSIDDLGGKPILKGKLFDIRCCWRVEDFRYTVEESLGKRVLRATWMDYGEERDRVARLWRLWEPWLEPLEIVIPDGASELEICGSFTELPPGPYLMSFHVDDPWGGGGLSTEFPIEDINTQKILIKAEGVHLSISECHWIDDVTLRVSGTLVNASGIKEVVVQFYSVMKGKYKSWKAETFTDESARFNLVVKNLYEKSVLKSGRSYGRANEITKKLLRPHWMGVFVRDKEPIYHFQVLPDPGGLWWPAFDSNFSDQQKVTGGQIYIDCLEVSLDEPLLSPEHSKQVLKLWQEGGKIPVNMRIGGEPKGAQLLKAPNSHLFKLELKTEAIKCTSCGKVEPDQGTWHKNHYPKCRSFKFNFKEIKVSLYWLCDLTSLFNQLNGKELYVWNSIMTLCCSHSKPLPDSLCYNRNDQYFDFHLEELTKELWQREVVFLTAMVGRHSK